MLISELPLTKCLAPRKKFRNPNRYFRKTLRKAEEFTFFPDNDGWWDLWHYHADWEGYGNLSWEIRLEYFRALAVVYRTIARQSKNFQTPFQLWIHLGADAGRDAVYLHTPNGNENPFPVRFTTKTVDCEHLVGFFSQALPDSKLKVKSFLQSRSTSSATDDALGLLIFVEGIGLGL